MLDYKLSFFKEGSRLHALRPLVTATDTFCYEPLINTKKGPHIRDAVDLKRWMMMVILALVPCIIWAIWNTGLQAFVYGSGKVNLMEEYVSSSSSFSTYFDFALKDDRWLTILWLGLKSFLPITIISYAVGGLWEGLFAVVRKHEIAEGFLVTGMLYPLILPASTPYWMVAVGVSLGVIISKELFGGTGMNIVNPALTCRAFLFFGYPGNMSGDIWVGTDYYATNHAISTMNLDAGRTGIDAFSTATPLSMFNITDDVKKIHVDAIASNSLGSSVNSYPAIETHFEKWSSVHDPGASLGHLSQDQLQGFVTGSLADGGLGLAPDNYDVAFKFSELNYDVGIQSDGNYFFGNMIGSMGETSTLACLIGAIILIYTGVGAWRTMVAMGLGAFVCAYLFQMGSHMFGADNGIWNSARYGLPAYKHLLMGGLAFGLVFMATDPVSSPSMKSAKWIYGFFIGACVIIIRVVNPAYPEGVMLAILLGNVFAPLIDHYSVQHYRRRAHRVCTT